MATAALRVPRGVDEYRDTSLDGLIGQESSFVRGSAHRRTGSGTRRSVSDTESIPSNVPPAPEVPRQPPVAYKGPPQDMASPQRSFSQRAQARPFLREALADDEARDSGYAESRAYRSPKEQRRDYAQLQDGQEPLHINTAVSGNQPPPSARAPTSSGANGIYPSGDSREYQRQSRQISEPRRQYEEPLSAATRSSAAREIPKLQPDGRGRDWAPDRSPLQKLEVTLNDISKEEKRARVEEAEMLLRESKAGRGGRVVSRDLSTRTQESASAARRSINRRSQQPEESTGLEEAGLVRNLSTTQRDRLAHSTTIESHKPDVRRLSGDGRRGFDYEEQEYGQDQSSRPVSATYTSPRERQRGLPSDADTGTATQGRASSRKKRTMDEQYPAPTSPRQMRRSERVQVSPQTDQSPQIPRQSPDMSTRFPQHNPVWQSDQSAPAYTVPSNITRAVSMQGKKPPVNFADDRDVSRSESLRKDTNTSHKAALAGAATVGAAAAAMEPVVARGGSRKLQKAPPPGYDRGQPQRDRRFSFEPGVERPLQRSNSKGEEIPVEQNTNASRALSRSQDSESRPGISQRPQAPIGLGLRQASAARNVDKPLPPSPESRRSRQPSVSFKEPDDRAQPLDEWRNAEPARLKSDHFALDQSQSEETEEYKAWWEQEQASSRQRGNRALSNSRARPSTGSSRLETGDEGGPPVFQPPLFLKCGPLLRYSGMKRTRQGSSGPDSVPDQVVWRGSVMIVTLDARSSYEAAPRLRLYSQPKKLLSFPPQVNDGEELAPEAIDPIAGLPKMSRIGTTLYVRPVDHLEQGKDLSLVENDDGLFESSPSPLDTEGGKEATSAVSNNKLSEMNGQRVGKFSEVPGARLYVDAMRGVTFWRFNLEIELGDEQAHVAYRINNGTPIGFWVPSRNESMNLMFHSCNGFSMSVDSNRFGGPDPLWRDVLNKHQEKPFHAMIGGGDQIYNDKVSAETRLFGEWTRMRNPEHKHNAPFSPDLREELETFYLDRYSMWFSQGLFGMANSQIPMINVWDDHDIIDGFGSYPDHFMKSPVFSGLGNVAFKYYMLFQHQAVPEEKASDEPSWILGAKPGPYITQQSRSLFLSLGKHLAFLGLDCRTERRHDEVLTEQTTEIVLERCRKELVEGETKHLIVLLGVPIAYPRLVWLETLLTSRAMDPVKALGRVGVLRSGFLNKFDGGVELLDDLDDHWTAKNHKHERNLLIEDLQDLAAEKSVRITILGGDVHLAAIGQFYSNPKLRIPKDHDHRYMPNVISSAIVNTPPSDMVADVLNKRNKVHHLNNYTDEQMVPIFTHDPEDRQRNNQRLLPKRNWCSIREYLPGSTPPPSPPDTPDHDDESDEELSPPQRPRRFSFTREDADPRKLFRRLTSRGAPPTSYRNGGSYEDPDQPIDPDCPVHGQEAPNSQSTLPSQQRNFSDAAVPNQRPASLDLGPKGRPQRPDFLRRPTNLSEKAARRGNVLAVNPDGTEFDVNDHINLEGGLDVVLNCEVRQGDVSGITKPYRFLVPALWYDGSSDREKFDETAHPHRKPTLLQRFGSAGKRPNDSDVPRPYEPEYESEAESHSGSEGADRKPRKLFGLFGSRRRNVDDYEHEEYHGPDQDLQAGYRGNDQLYNHEGPRPDQLHDQAGSRQSYVISSQPPVPPPHATTSPEARPSRTNSPPQQNRDIDSDEEDVDFRPPPKRVSKQARLLGLVSDDQQPAPGQVPLRGNGIIGRRVSNPDTEREFQKPRGRGGSPDQVDQSYTGPTAYRPPKPERRWSLKAVRNRARSGTRWDYYQDSY